MNASFLKVPIPRPSPLPAKAVGSMLMHGESSCDGTPGFSGAYEECPKKRQGTLQRAALDQRLADRSAPPAVQDVLRSAGQPHDTATRSFMEPRFGHDFSRLPINAPPVVVGDCPMSLASARACPFGGACHTCPAHVQAKLAVSQPGDVYEQEADRIAEAITRGAEPLVVQGKCAHCSDEDDEELERKERPGQLPDSEMQPETLVGVHSVLHSAGQPLNEETLAFMEPRFGRDFQHVRVHTDPKAAESAAAVGARAYTVGTNMVFGAGEYEPQTRNGQELLAHELVHVVQQSSGSVGQESLQRVVLRSPRLLGNRVFTDVANNTRVLRIGDTGQEVRRIQQLLIDLGFGYALSNRGANGNFDSQTEAAIKKYQTTRGLTQSGTVDEQTIGALDADFPPFALPTNRNAPWSMPCVLGILCPWNRNLVQNVLPRFNIITFDSRSFPTETWNGTTWIAGTFHSGGFRNGMNMGFLNTNCQDFASTIYHEGWHGQQPSGLTGVVEIEKDAFVNTEQWTMAVGIPGMTFRNRDTGNVEDLRTTSSAGENIVDEAAAETLVRQKYGGVSSVPGERILRRVGPRNVRVRRPNGSEYERPAATGESVRGPVNMTNQRPIPGTDWHCP